MPDERNMVVVDALTLKFEGRGGTDSELHELRAAHVAEVLQGIAAFSSDFDQAGVFNPDGPANSEILVRPPQEGSFILELVRVVHEVAHDLVPLVKAATPMAEVGVAVGTAAGIPSLSTLIWWATKSIRADVENFDYLPNGMMKVMWQDKTVDEIPVAAWKTLNTFKRRRKSQLRQIMAPLADRNVTTLNLSDTSGQLVGQSAEDGATDVHVLERQDYDAAKPEADADADEKSRTFETEAQLSVVNFDNPGKWKVKTKEGSRTANVEDKAFLEQVAKGLALRNSDIFRLQIRETASKTKGRKKTTWTVLKVESFRRASGDKDT